MNSPNLVFRQLFDAPSSTYTYLLADPRTRQAVIIDTVFEQHGRDCALLGELGLELVAVLDTHCHADHVTGAWLMQQATGCRIGVSKRYQPPIQGADLPLDHGNRIVFGERHLAVRATPGHTDGCMTLVLDDSSMAFTGDALLIRGTGRCDFQQGSASALFQSITREIFSLPDRCLLYPCHDYSGRTVSSVAEERTYNPRVGGAADERDFVGLMANLNLPHPKRIDVAIPANLRSGRPADGAVPRPSDWGPVRQTYAGLLEIEPEWVAEHLGQVHVLDVRESSELLDSPGAIAGCQRIPLSALRERLAEIPGDKPVVAVCHAGMRSGQATVILRSGGLTRCANLRGGMVLWSQLGLPTLPGRADSWQGT
ncbi:MAG TPA: MBL fold metallo-hydrolase [Burkholderiaceae bacterium]|nr:MBL fold metallo-hydrolase [Burkholderiaceae bacterium]HQR71556.1 MBL fold metallo-hydrolase [Burkholderiaceae bacterium]